MARFLLITILAVLLLPTSALAAKPYHCNGRVQFRPCEPGAEPQLIRTRRDSPPRFSRRPSIKSKAKIVSSSFTALRGQKGRWRGYVSGVGLAQLTLDIFREGKRLTSKYMGKVNLTPQDKKVSFAFESSTPKGGNWTWAIRVRTT